MTEITHLPSLADQLERLQVHGEQFSAEDRRGRRQALPDVVMADGEPAFYDAGVVPFIPRMIVPGGGRLLDALQAIRPGQETTQNTDKFVERVLGATGITLGFSGYATEGAYGYHHEAAGIKELLQLCEDEELPVSSIVCGGTGYGTPGLVTVLGKQRHIPTSGLLPLRSLRGAAPTDTTVVIGEEFGAEVQALGRASDILAVLGGGPLAEEEVLAALGAGILVIVLSNKAYRKDSTAYLHERNETVRQAHADGQLQVCGAATDTELAAVVAGLDMEWLQSTRAARKAPLLQALRGQ